jgi:hypothetical protein
MFLEHHLAEAHGIAGRAVVGFVNDGSDDAYGYHAWFEASGRITDVALCRPQHPSRQQAGPLVILGRRMGGGHPWAYHHERPPEGTAAVRALARTPVLGSAITAAEDEHARMASVAASPSLVRGYLDRAPDGWDYRRLAALVEEGA